jgi:hypothetical protein
MNRCREPLVVTRLIGGLGNQMFQYAAGRALALRRGADLKLDVAAFTAGVDTKRRYELDSFSIHGSAASDAELARFGRAGKPRSSPFDRVLRRLRIERANGAWPIYRERHFQFDPAVPELQTPVYLDGFWQSERYFSDIAEMLRQEFRVKGPMDLENKAFVARIESVNAVSLHVRRGDYISDPATNRYHGICSPDYYERSVEYVAARTGSPYLFVFSDDQQWTRTNLRFAVPAMIVDANPSDSGHRDMHLMALCRHHIIANSSFSWWGAWLNPSHEKIVVAPRQWFGVSSNDTRDLISRNWVRL